VVTRHGLGSVVHATSAGGAIGITTNTIAVLVAGLDPFYLPLLRGIEDAANERGTLVLIADTRDSATLANAMARRLMARGVDGIIAISVGDLPDPLPGRDGTLLPPIVYIDQPDRQGYSLLFDGAEAGGSATRHLCEHGHSRIGLITAPLSWPNVAEVHRGYLQALTDASLTPLPELVSEVAEFSIAAGRAGLDKLLALPDPPTAVLAAGSSLAPGATHAARLSGLSVPDDLAIVGYTDSALATLIDAPLTMVDVPAREVGLRAIRTLSALIDGKKPRPRRKVLPTELIVRDSCGPHQPYTTIPRADPG
jgi:LacI family repressor for deo operon, udp, cdd, tsx, nupC, and nupG